MLSFFLVYQVKSLVFDNQRSRFSARDVVKRVQAFFGPGNVFSTLYLCRSRIISTSSVWPDL